MTRAFLFVLAVVVAAAASILVLTEDPHPPHRALPKAGVAIGTWPLSAVGGESTTAVETSVREYVEGVLEYEAEVEAERLRAAREAASVRVAPSRSGTSGACGTDLECFLACTRAHESDTAGGYGAVDPSGTYRGAYQFAAGTWAGAVTRAGYPEYAGTPADQVPAHVQDAAAAQLYAERGTQPWGGRC